MTMITPSYLGETIEYSSLHACRSTLEDPTVARRIVGGSNARTPAIIFVSTYDEEEFSRRIAASPALGFIAKTQLSVERIRGLLGD